MMEALNTYWPVIAFLAVAAAAVGVLAFAKMMKIDITAVLELLNNARGVKR